MTTIEKTARTVPPPEPSPVSTPGSRGVLWLLTLVPFVVVLDSTSINVSLPTISEALALTSQATSWVVNAYLVTFGGLLLLGGRLSDVLPRRGLLLAGLALFTVAGVASTAAPTGGMLIVARAVQGIGAALITPTALALITSHFPAGPARARALGMWGVGSGAGGAVGVLASGLLVSGPGWRWSFLVGVLVAAVAAIGAVRVLPARPARGGAVDLVGAVSVTVGLSALTYALTVGAEQGWGRPAPLAAAAAALVLLAVFVRSCRRSATPLVRPALARIRTVATANVVILAVGGVSVASFFVLPQYQQHVLAWSPAAVGLSQLPLAAAIVISSVLAPRLAVRFGRTLVLAAGLGLLVVGLTWLALTPADLGGMATVTGYVVPSLLVGAGVGTGFVLATELGVATVAPADNGAASGLLSASREVGGALVLAMVTAAATTLAPAGRGLGGTIGGLGSGYGIALLSAAVIAAAAAAFLAWRTRASVTRVSSTATTSTGQPNEVRP